MPQIELAGVPVQPAEPLSQPAALYLPLSAGNCTTLVGTVVSTLNSRAVEYADFVPHWSWACTSQK